MEAYHSTAVVSKDRPHTTSITSSSLPQPHTQSAADATGAAVAAPSPAPRAASSFSVPSLPTVRETSHTALPLPHDGAVAATSSNTLACPLDPFHLLLRSLMQQDVEAIVCPVVVVKNNHYFAVNSKPHNTEALGAGGRLVTSTSTSNVRNNSRHPSLPVGGDTTPHVADPRIHRGEDRNPAAMGQGVAAKQPPAFAGDFSQSVLTGAVRLPPLASQLVERRRQHERQHPQPGTDAIPERELNKKKGQQLDAASAPPCVPSGHVDSSFTAAHTTDTLLTNSSNNNMGTLTTAATSASVSKSRRERTATFRDDDETVMHVRYSMSALPAISTPHFLGDTTGPTPGVPLPPPTGSGKSAGERVSPRRHVVPATRASGTATPITELDGQRITPPLGDGSPGKPGVSPHNGPTPRGGDVDRRRHASTEGGEADRGHLLRDFPIVYANEAALRLLGHKSSTELVGREFENAFRCYVPHGSDAIGGAHHGQGLHPTENRIDLSPLSSTTSSVNSSPSRSSSSRTKTGGKGTSTRRGGRAARRGLHSHSFYTKGTSKSDETSSRNSGSSSVHAISFLHVPPPPTDAAFQDAPALEELEKVGPLFTEDAEVYMTLYGVVEGKYYTCIAVSQRRVEGLEAPPSPPPPSPPVPHRCLQATTSATVSECEPSREEAAVASVDNQQNECRGNAPSGDRNQPCREGNTAPHSTSSSCGLPEIHHVTSHRRGGESTNDAAAAVREDAKDVLQAGGQPRRRSPDSPSFSSMPNTLAGASVDTQPGRSARENDVCFPEPPRESLDKGLPAILPSHTRGLGRAPEQRTASSFSAEASGTDLSLCSRCTAENSASDAAVPPHSSCSPPRHPPPLAPGTAAFFPLSVGPPTPLSQQQKRTDVPPSSSRRHLSRAKAAEAMETPYLMIFFLQQFATPESGLVQAQQQQQQQQQQEMSATLYGLATGAATTDTLASVSTARTELSITAAGSSTNVGPAQDAALTENATISPCSSRIDERTARRPSTGAQDYPGGQRGLPESTPAATAAAAVTSPHPHETSGANLVKGFGERGTTLLNPLGSNRENQPSIHQDTSGPVRRRSVHRPHGRSHHRVRAGKRSSYSSVSSGSATATVLGRIGRQGSDLRNAASSSPEVARAGVPTITSPPTHMRPGTAHTRHWSHVTVVQQQQPQHQHVHEQDSSRATWSSDGDSDFVPLGQQRSDYISASSVPFLQNFSRHNSTSPYANSLPSPSAGEHEGPQRVVSTTTASPRFGESPLEDSLWTGHPRPLPLHLSQVSPTGHVGADARTARPARQHALNSPAEDASISGRGEDDSTSNPIHVDSGDRRTSRWGKSSGGENGNSIGFSMSFTPFTTALTMPMTPVGEAVTCATSSGATQATSGPAPDRNALLQPSTNEAASLSVKLAEDRAGAETHAPSSSPPSQGPPRFQLQPHIVHNLLPFSPKSSFLAEKRPQPDPAATTSPSNAYNRRELPQATNASQSTTSVAPLLTAQRQQQYPSQHATWAHGVGSPPQPLTARPSNSSTSFGAAVYRGPLGTGAAGGTGSAEGPVTASGFAAGSESTTTTFPTGSSGASAGAAPGLLGTLASTSLASNTVLQTGGSTVPAYPFGASGVAMPNAYGSFAGGGVSAVLQASQAQSYSYAPNPNAVLNASFARRGASVTTLGGGGGSGFLPSANIYAHRAHAADAMTHTRLTRQLRQLHGVDHVCVAANVPENFFLHQMAMMLVLQRAIRHVQEANLVGADDLVAFASVRATMLIVDLLPADLFHDTRYATVMDALQQRRIAEAKELRRQRVLKDVAKTDERRHEHPSPTDEPQAKMDQQLRMIDHAVNTGVTLGAASLGTVAANSTSTPYWYVFNQSSSTGGSAVRGDSQQQQQQQQSPGVVNAAVSASQRGRAASAIPSHVHSLVQGTPLQQTLTQPRHPPLLHSPQDISFPAVANSTSTSGLYASVPPQQMGEVNAPLGASAPAPVSSPSNSMPRPLPLATSFGESLSFQNSFRISLANSIAGTGSGGPSRATASPSDPASTGFTNKEATPDAAGDERGEIERRLNWAEAGNVEEADHFLSLVVMDLLIACEAKVWVRHHGTHLASVQVAFPYITPERLDLLPTVEGVQLTRQKALATFGIATANELTEEAVTAASAPAPAIIPLRYDGVEKRFSQILRAKSVTVLPLSAEVTSANQSAKEVVPPQETAESDQGQQRPGDDRSSDETGRGGSPTIPKHGHDASSHIPPADSFSTGVGTDARDVPSADVSGEADTSLSCPAPPPSDEDCDFPRRLVNDAMASSHSGKPLASGLTPPKVRKTLACEQVSGTDLPNFDLSTYDVAEYLSSLTTTTAAAAPNPDEAAHDNKEESVQGKKQEAHQTGGQSLRKASTATDATAAPPPGGVPSFSDSRLLFGGGESAKTLSPTAAPTTPFLRGQSSHGGTFVGGGSGHSAGLANAAAGAGALPAVLGRDTGAAPTAHDNADAVHKVKTAAPTPTAAKAKDNGRSPPTPAARASDKRDTPAPVASEGGARKPAAEVAPPEKAPTAVSAPTPTTSTHSPSKRRPASTSMMHAATPSSTLTTVTIASSGVTPLFGYTLSETASAALAKFTTSFDRASVRLKPEADAKTDCNEGKGPAVTTQAAEKAEEAADKAAAAGRAAASAACNDTSAHQDQSSVLGLPSALTVDESNSPITQQPPETAARAATVPATRPNPSPPPDAQRGGNAPATAAATTTTTAGTPTAAAAASQYDWRNNSFVGGLNDSFSFSRNEFFGFTNPRAFADVRFEVETTDASGSGRSSSGRGAATSLAPGASSTATDRQAEESGKGSAEQRDFDVVASTAPGQRLDDTPLGHEALSQRSHALSSPSPHPAEESAPLSRGATRGLREFLNIVLFTRRERDDIDDALSGLGHVVITISKPRKLARFIRSGLAGVDVLVVEWDRRLITAELRELLLFNRPELPVVIMFHLTCKTDAGASQYTASRTTHSIDRGSGLLDPFALEVTNHAKPEDILQMSPDISTVFHDRQTYAQLMEGILKVRLKRQMLDVRLRQSYQILKSIGQGQFGDVYEVLMVVSKGRLAMKRFLLNSSSVKLFEQLYREVQIMSQLDHQNIISFSHTRFEGNAYEIFMELADGTLEQRIAKPKESAGWAQRDQSNIPAPVLAAWRSNPIFAQQLQQPGQDPHSPSQTVASPLRSSVDPLLADIVDPFTYMQPTPGVPIAPHEATLILHDVASAIQYLHSNNIIHRDIKPLNILFSDGLAKLADFGSAVRIKQDRMLTSMKGTIQYMAPEVFVKEPYGKPCDIWSLGCVIADVMGLRLGHLVWLHSPALAELYESIPPDECVPMTLTNKYKSAFENHRSAEMAQRALEALQKASRTATQERRARNSSLAADTASTTTTTQHDRDAEAARTGTYSHLSYSSDEGTRSVPCLSEERGVGFCAYTVTLPRSLVELFEGLFRRDPAKRMTIEDVLDHPVCWDTEWMRQMMTAIHRATAPSQENSGNMGSGMGAAAGAAAMESGDGSGHGGARGAKRLTASISLDLSLSSNAHLGPAAAAAAASAAAAAFTKAVSGAAVEQDSGGDEGETRAALPSATVAVSATATLTKSPAAPPPLVSPEAPPLLTDTCQGLPSESETGNVSNITVVVASPADSAVGELNEPTPANQQEAQPQLQHPQPAQSQNATAVDLSLHSFA